MVLGLQGPGRVGRRRFLHTNSRPLWRLSSFYDPFRRHDRPPASRSLGRGRSIRRRSRRSTHSRRPSDISTTAFRTRARRPNASRSASAAIGRSTASASGPAPSLRTVGRSASSASLIRCGSPISRTRWRSAGACTRTRGATGTRPRRAAPPSGPPATSSGSLESSPSSIRATPHRSPWRGASACRSSEPCRTRNARATSRSTQHKGPDPLCSGFGASECARAARWRPESGEDPSAARPDRSVLPELTAGGRGGSGAAPCRAMNRRGAHLRPGRDHPWTGPAATMIERSTMRVSGGGGVRGRGRCLRGCLTQRGELQGRVHGPAHQLAKRALVLATFDHRREHVFVRLRAGSDGKGPNVRDPERPVRGSDGAEPKPTCAPESDLAEGSE